jgi:hypothetical protein
MQGYVENREERKKKGKKRAEEIRGKRKDLKKKASFNARNMMP